MNNDAVPAPYVANSDILKLCINSLSTYVDEYDLDKVVCHSEYHVTSSIG